MPDTWVGQPSDTASLHAVRAWSSGRTRNGFRFDYKQPVGTRRAVVSAPSPVMSCRTGAGLIAESTAECWYLRRTT